MSVHDTFCHYVGCRRHFLSKVCPRGWTYQLSSGGGVGARGPACAPNGSHRTAAAARAAHDPNRSCCCVKKRRPAPAREREDSKSVPWTMAPGTSRTGCVDSLGAPKGCPVHAVWPRSRGASGVVSWGVKCLPPSCRIQLVRVVLGARPRRGAEARVRQEARVGSCARCKWTGTVEVDGAPKLHEKH